MVQTIHSMQLVPASNALLFTGSPENIQELSNILATLDTPGSPPTTAELAEMQPPPEKTEVFVYKLRYLSATDLQTMLHDIASHANANRPSAETKAFVNAVDTMRIIPEANAVQFVTTPEIISQIKELLVTLDISDNAKSQVQSSNGSNFLIYKVKNMNPEDLLSQVKQIVKASPHQDSLLKCVATAQYAASSNSLIFTGRKADLDKVQILLETLDEGQVPLPTKVTPSRRAEGYKLYRPQHIAGTELIARVRNFEQTLVASGVTDYSLAETVDHLAYIERTNVIVVTGTEADISQVMTLLQEFDTEGIAKKGPDIETIDDTGFLIYKLQHQGGAGIVGALSVISRDLNTQTAMKKNEGLIEAIRSTQWIEPTNSLIATGQPKVLSRLRELIESIDQPLKQVFIEVLVLETNNTSDFEFGLRWGSQGAVNNKFSWGSGNYSPLDSQSASSSGTTNTGFAYSFNQITGTRTPTGSDIPPIEGGLFGVIGGR